VEDTGVRRILAIVIVAALLSAAAPAQQQIYGVGPAPRDASPMVGANGYNAPIPSRYQPNYGNLFITGNVRGGKDFRGFVPYDSPTQFGAPLGSDRLRSFQRESVGVMDVRQGQTFGQPIPYYHPSSTVLPLPALEAGLNIPGSSEPRYPSLLPATNLEARRVPMISDPVLTGVGLPPLPEGIRETDVLVPPVLARPTPTAEPQLPLLPGEEERQLPERTLERELMLEELEAALEEESPVEPMIGPLAEPEGPEGVPSPARPEQGFGQMLQQAERAAAGGPVQVIREPAAEGEAPLPPAAPPVLPRAGVQPQQAVLSTLAEPGGEPVAQLMTAGQRQMGGGRYLEAAALFRQAQAVQPDHIPAVLGQVNALLAAGELRNAAGLLEQLLARHPELVYLEYDGRNLMGGKTIVDRRLEQVRQLIRRDEVGREVLLLAGYVELLAGNPQPAYELLGRAGLIHYAAPTTQPNRP